MRNLKFPNGKLISNEKIITMKGPSSECANNNRKKWAEVVELHGRFSIIIQFGCDQSMTQDIFLYFTMPMPKNVKRVQHESKYFRILESFVHLMFDTFL